MLQLFNKELQPSTAVWAGNEENEPSYLKMGVWGMEEGIRVAIDYSRIGALGLPD